MKRNHSGLPSGPKPSQRSKRTSASHSKKAIAASVLEWTAEEDDYLKQHASSRPHISWLSICKGLNKRFKNARRTVKDCQGRWSLLRNESHDPNASNVTDESNEPNESNGSNVSHSPWTPNEELLLLYGLHKLEGDVAGMVRILGQRSVAEIRARIQVQLHNLVLLINGRKSEDVVSAPPLRQLQLLVYLRLLFKALEPQGSGIPEAAEAVAEGNLKAEDCLRFLQRWELHRSWDKNRLFGYLEDVMERLENRLASAGTQEDAGGLEDVFHRRIEENGVHRRVRYLHILSRPVTGRELYVIAIYYLSD